MARIAKAARPGTGGQGGEGRSGWQQARRQVHSGLVFRLYSDLPVFGWSLPLASSSFFLGRDNLGHVRKEAFFLRDPTLTLTYSATYKESLCEAKPLKVATHFLCLAHYVHRAGWIIRTG